MNVSKSVVFLGVSIVLTVGLLTGCGGGGGTQVNDGFVVRCADGTLSARQSTLERAQAACSTHGGVATTQQ